MMNHRVRSGPMRHRLDIESASEVQDVYGDPVKTWSNVDTVWASIEPLQGEEKFHAQQVDALITHRIVIRHFAALTHNHRFVEGSRLFYIKSITNISELDHKMVCMCTEDV